MLHNELLVPDYKAQLLHLINMSIIFIENLADFLLLNKKRQKKGQDHQRSCKCQLLHL